MEKKITFQDLTIFRFTLVYLFMNTNLSKAKIILETDQTNIGLVLIEYWENIALIFMCLILEIYIEH